MTHELVAPVSWPDPKLWPYAPRYHQLPEGRLHYVDEGQGEPYLFVHGTPTWSFEWRHGMSALTGHRRIAVDHLGFGRSDQPLNAGYRPEDHADRFRQFAESLDLHDLTLVIHDYGGPIALPWALDNLHRIKRLVIVNTWAWSFDGDPAAVAPAKLLGSAFGRWLYRWCNLSLRVLMPMGWADRSRLTPSLREHYHHPFHDRGSRGQILWPLAKGLLSSSDFFSSLEDRLSSLSNTPVTILWGMKDSAFTEEHLNRWRRHLPHGKVVEISDAGHWPHEESPARWLAGLRADDEAPMIARSA